MKKLYRSVSQVRIIYSLTTIFLVGLSIFTFFQVTHLFKALASVNETNDVRMALHTISKDLIKAESQRRGFLLSGDSVMLKHHGLALDVLQGDIDSLVHLITDHPDQIDNMEDLSFAINELLASVSDLRKDRYAQQDDGAAAQAGIHTGVEKMDSINFYMNKIDVIESKLLHLRLQLFSRLSVKASICIITLFLGALLILFFSYFKLTNQLKESQQLHADLFIQNQDRGALSRELFIVNEELAYQNEEKEKRAAELLEANEKLALQNKEKESHAADLVKANNELALQNMEKEKLAAELERANKELALQNEEKEKRAIELNTTNKELELFLNISSHDLQEPLRKIQMSASRIDQNDFEALSEKGREHFMRMQEAARNMHTLIKDLLTYSKTNSEIRKFEDTELGVIIEEVKLDLEGAIEEKCALIEVTGNCKVNIIPFQFRQLICNIISNALKFSRPGTPPIVRITSSMKYGRELDIENLLPDKEYCHISIADNGIGFEPEYKTKIFDVFQRLHGREDYEGTGIGLSIVKKIVDNHNGVIMANGELQQGATFDIYIPTIKNEPHG